MIGGGCVVVVVYLRVVVVVVDSGSGKEDWREGKGREGLVGNVIDTSLNHFSHAMFFLHIFSLTSILH